MTTTTMTMTTMAMATATTAERQRRGAVMRGSRRAVNRRTMRAMATGAEENATSASSAGKKTPTTVEYQRQQAKMMVKYFKEKQYDQAVEEAQVFGFTAKNEIGNGRAVMMGLAIGMLTELATGVNFIDQIKLTISVLGIADIYD